MADIPPLQASWNSDRRLDILVLGPMSEDETTAASCVPVQQAVQELLREPEFEELLAQAGVAPGDRVVHVPERFGGQDIVHGVLTRLDIADLVIFNMTPKPGKDEASANVFYELGLVHSLGIPAMIVMEKGPKDNQPPFYARGMKQHRVADFSIPSLVESLRPSLREFLLRKDPHNHYLNDRITQFYGLPVVDISAAVGLATGYYFNFVSRLISESGFIAVYPELIRHVLLVRPSSVDSTYQADMLRLKEGLTAAGHALATTSLQPPAWDNLGPLWVDHVADIVVDLPRTLYPLQRAPRILAFKHRNITFSHDPVLKQRLKQFGEQLLDRVEAGIRYHMQFDGPRVRAQAVHFTTIEEAPALIARLRKP